MKHIRHVYYARHGNRNFQKIDSDDPRLGGQGGTLRVAALLGERLARELLGPNGELLDMREGKTHRRKTGSLKRVRPSARLDTSGWTDWHLVIACPGGCDAMECEIVTIQIRVSRARGERRYYEIPPPPPRSPAPLKRGPLPEVHHR